MTIPTQAAGHDARIADLIARLLARRQENASICPSEVARALHADGAAWRAAMPRVRHVARRLARSGTIVITRRGVAVDPDQPFRGPIRLARAR